MDSPASSDEGEIRDGSVEKANMSLPQYDGTSVDRPDRNRSSNSNSKSPEHGQRSRDRALHDRSRSPYDQPRGSKRSRGDDYTDRSQDPRRFKVHYEDADQDYRRRPRGYEDLDRGSTASAALQYDERDRPEKRPRTRSRSPYRSSRGGDRNGHSSQSRRDNGRHNSYANDHRRPDSYGHGDLRSWESRDQPVSKRGPSPLPADNARQEAKITKGYSQRYADQSANHNGEHRLVCKSCGTVHANIVCRSNGELKVPTVEAPEEEPLDEAALIEQRRKRREAIKAKYRGPATSLLAQALLGDRSGDSTPGQQDESTPSARSSRFFLSESIAHADLETASPMISAPGTPTEAQDPESPAVFAVTNDQELANSKGEPDGDENDGPSAADYDPTMDMREDKQRDDQRHSDEVSSGAYDETKRTTEQDVLLPSTEVVDEKPEKSKDDFDMFAEDDDDMFAEDPLPNGDSSADKSDVAKAVPIPQAKELDIGMLDNWDDIEGYYKVILGELLNGRYHVQANLGKGMFSGVVRALDVTTKKLVAIKLIRNNETM
jgi:serine/threonine-protein kinase PRP4